MADINKFTTKEVLNKVLLDSSGNSVAANSHTSQEALNAVLDVSNSRLNVSLGGSNTISGDVTITGDLTVQGGGSQAFDEIIQGSLKATANYDSGDNQGSVLFESNLGTAVGTVVDLFHNSASPAANDFVGLIRGMGNDSAGNLTEYGSIGVYVEDPTSTGEDGYIRFNTSENGTASERMRIDSSGNVGIGESSSIDKKLHIKSSTSGDGITIENSSTGASVIRFEADSSALRGLIGVEDHDGGSSITGSSGYATFIRSEADIQFASGGNNLALTIDSSQNVGIGTASPSHKLSVSGAITIDGQNVAHDTSAMVLSQESSAKSQMRIYGADSSTRGELEIKQSYNDGNGTLTTLYLNSSGNVGIGTTPVSPLHVKGLVNNTFSDTLDSSDFSGDTLVIENRPASSNDDYVSIAMATSGSQFVSSRIVLDNDGSGAGALNFQLRSPGDLSNTTTFMKIKSTGDVEIPSGSLGIGTTSPDSELEIFHATDPQIKFSINTHGDAGIILGDADGVKIFGKGVGNEVRLYSGASTVALRLDANSRISLSNNDSGFENTIFGKDAGKSIVSGADKNAFFGAFVADSTLTNGADFNAGFGYGSLSSLTSGAYNTALGSASMLNVASASYGVAVGNQAMGSGIATQDGTVAIGYSSLYSLTSGPENVAIGFQSADAITTGGYNTAVGHGTLSALVGGNFNTALGRNALASVGNNETSNIGIGANAMGACNEGTGSGNQIDQNIAIGVETLTGANFGSTGGRVLTNNIAIGGDALNSTGTNSQNGTIAIGFGSLTALTSGAGNTAVGYLSGNAITTGASNTLIGYSSGSAVTTQSQLTAIGHEALKQSNGATSSIAIGYRALYGTNAGTCGDNIAIGNNAMVANITHVTRSIAIGTEALGALVGASTPSDNIAIGYRAGNSMTNCSNNIAIGGSAMGETGSNAITGGSNTAIGTNAMYNAEGAVANNTAVGANALLSVTTGSNNTVIGRLAGDAITTGNSNIVVGDSALGAATTATLNVAIGGDCMSLVPASVAIQDVVAIGQNAFKGSASTTDGANGTVAIGRDSLKELTSGSGNTAVGYQTLDATTTQSNSTAIGYNAGGASAGNSNLFVGYNAGATGTNDVVSGTQNTIVGTSAEASSASAQGQIVLGVGAVGQGDHTAVIGGNAVTDVYMAQDSGATVHCSGVNFPDSQSASADANTLDDYEEGTFTPTITTGSGSAGLNASFSAGEYTKIGNLVTAIYKIRIGTRSTSPAPSGTLDIALPFTAGSGTGANSSSGTGVLIGEFNGDTDGTLVALASGSDASILRDTDGNYNDDCGQFLPAVGGYIQFSVQYTVD